MKDLERIEYENGLVLVMEEVPNTKKAALFVGVGVGSVDEDDILNGGSHFNEHLLFKSNPHRSARQIIEDLEYSGSIVNACTSWKYTGFYAKSPGNEVAKSLEILYEAASNFDYDEAEFELERKVILTEIENYINSPDKYALLGLEIPELFKNTSLEKKIEGTVESMGSVSKKALEDFKEKYYVPNNMVISVCGRFEKEKIKDYVEESFASLKKKPLPERESVSLKNQKSYKEETRSDITQSYFNMGYRVPGYSSEDHFKLELLSSILSEGLSSRMFHELRELRGIGYSVGNFYYPNGDDAMLISHVDGFDPERLDEARKVILDIYEDLKRNPVPEKELSGTKKLMLSKYDDSLEKITERAIMHYYTEIYDIPFDFREKEKHIQKITAEDLMEAAEKYLTDDFVETLLKPENLR